MLAGEDHQSIIDLCLTATSQKLFELTNTE